MDWRYCRFGKRFQWWNGEDPKPGALAQARPARLFQLLANWRISRLKKFPRGAGFAIAACLVGLGEIDTARTAMDEYLRLARSQMPDDPATGAR